MIWEFLQVFPNVRTRQHFQADDTIDKVNRSYTVIFLIISAILIGTRTLVGPAIVCLKDPAQTLSITMNYVESTCWAKYTFKLTNETYSKSPRVHVAYYQWLPFILVFLAFCFYVPYLIWKFLMRSNCGELPVDVSGVINLLKSSTVYKMQEFNATLKLVVDYLNNCFIYNSIEFKHAVRTGQAAIDYDLEANGRFSLIKLNDNYQKLSKASASRGRCCLHGLANPLQGKTLVLKYLLVKLIYIFISISMFWFINLFLRFEDGFSLFGYTMIDRFLIKGENLEKIWNSSLHFPREVLCELEIRADMSGLHRTHNVCSLPTNIFNEKIFIFLWFWFMLVAILNVLSLLKWICMILARKALVEKYLTLTPYINVNQANNSFFRYETNDARLVSLFINNYLQHDGLCMLLLMKSNLNDVYFRRLIDALWKIYAISNLDDQDLMHPSPPCHTSTANTNNNKCEMNAKLNLTSPVVVPQQPSATSSKHAAQRKFLFDDNVSESKVKLIDAEDKNTTVNDDSDYFNNETQQQRLRSQPLPPPPPQQQQRPKNGTYVAYDRKEELV